MSIVKYAMGGPVSSPYSSSITPMQGVGGMFQDQNQFGRDVADLRGSPLQNYQEYLMGTYGKMAEDAVQKSAQQDVEHFVKLVDEAERAHFGAEESFGFGGGQMHLDSLSAFDKVPDAVSSPAMTRAIGEDGGGGMGMGFSTTQVMGEDGGGGMAFGGGLKMTTQAIGEDGGGGGEMPSYGEIATAFEPLNRSSDLASAEMLGGMGEMARAFEPQGVGGLFKLFSGGGAV